MKYKRAKVAKRILEFYSVHFGVRPPYKVLVDGSYLHTALTCKKEMPADLNKYLGVRCKLFVTPGILRELEKLGEPVSETLAFARTLPVVDSPAPPEASARECILAALGSNNEGHYMVGTVDKALARGVRAVPGTPLLYLNRDVFVIEPPQAAAKATAKARGRERVAALAKDAVGARKAALGDASRAHAARLAGSDGATAAVADAGSEVQGQAPRGRKRAKGPNPLSVMPAKKRRAQAAGGAGDKQGKKKRTRRGSRGKGKPSGEGGGEE